MEHLDRAGELFSRYGVKRYFEQVLAKKEILKPELLDYAGRKDYEGPIQPLAAARAVPPALTRRALKAERCAEGAALMRLVDTASFRWPKLHRDRLYWLVARPELIARRRAIG